MSADTTPLSLRATRTSLRRLARMPRRALRVMAGRSRVVDGAALLPEAQVVIRFLEGAPGESFERLPLPQARAELDLEHWLFGADTHIALVTDTTVDGAAGPLDARRYEPAPGRPAPGLLVWFHSGGHVLGGLDTNDSLCRFLARSSGLTVLSVAYRLAPENPYPADVEDAVAATRHALAHLDEIAPGAPVVVGGEGAGAALAAVCAERVEGLAGQLLVTPWLELEQETASHELFGDRGTLTRAQLAWFRGHYLPDPALAAEASPARAQDLSGRPPAVVVVLGFDPLRDEALAHAQRLEQAGVPVTVVREDGLPHGGLDGTGVSARAREVADEVGRAVRCLVDPQAAAERAADEEAAREQAAAAEAAEPATGGPQDDGQAEGRGKDQPEDRGAGTEPGR